MNTVKMDKGFDFTSLLEKQFVVSDAPEISETNTIKDEVYKKGLLKTIIMAGNGVFEVVDSRYGFSVKNQSDTYPGLGAAYESLADGCFVTTNPAPRLPRKAVESVIEWYRRITAANGQEAQVNFYWNQYKRETIMSEDDVETCIADIPGVVVWNEELFSYTPKQYNSHSLTEVAFDDPWYDVFNRNFGMYVETHSHNSMDAFASGTDEANSSNDGFQLVFGRLNTDNPVMYSWMTMNYVMRLGMKEDELAKIMETNPASLYDLASEKVIYDASQLEFDEALFAEWDAQVVERPRPKYPQTNTYSYSQQNWWNQQNNQQWWKQKPAYHVLDDQEEYDEVVRLFNEAIYTSDLHAALMMQKETIEYTKVVEMLRTAFLNGYKASSEGPYTVTNVTKPQFETAVSREAGNILNQFYKLG